MFKAEIHPDLYVYTFYVSFLVFFKISSRFSSLVVSFTQSTLLWRH